MKDTTYKLFTRNRRKREENCTDFHWIVLFCILWVGLGVITVFAFVYGNYWPIIKGYDSFANICGFKEKTKFSNIDLSVVDATQRPYLLFMDNFNLSHVFKICVKHCIDEPLLDMATLLRQCNKKQNSVCRYDFNMKVFRSLNKHFSDKLGPCPVLSKFKSFPVKNRCIPQETDIRRLAEIYAYISTTSGPLVAFSVDTYQAWPYMFASVAFALVLSAVLLCSMRWITRGTTRSLGLLALSSTVAVSIIMWLIVLRMPSVESDMFVDFAKEEGRVLYNFLEDFRWNKTLTEVVGVLSLLLAEGLVIMVVCTRKEVPRVIVMCEEAVKCWKQLPSLSGVAATTFSVITLYFVYWTYIMLGASTSSFKEVAPLGEKAEYKDDPNIRLRVFFQLIYVEMKWLQNCCWINIIGFVWTSEFICGCQRFWLEALTTNWYFRRTATWSLLKGHVGSVLRGSLMGSILVIRFVCAVLCTILRHFSLEAAEFMGAIEKQLRMVPGIYAIVGFRGISLYRAGKTVNAILAGGADHLNDVSDCVHFVFLSAQLLVANLTCLLGVLLLKDVEDLFFYMAPVVLSSLYALYIARVVLSTIEVPLHTLFLCVCEDKIAYNTHGRYSRKAFVKSCFQY